MQFGAAGEEEAGATMVASRETRAECVVASVETTNQHAPTTRTYDTHDAKVVFFVLVAVVLGR